MENYDELFYVLEGELFIELENAETVSLKPGAIFTVPANTMHLNGSLSNEGINVDTSTDCLR